MRGTASSELDESRQHARVRARYRGFASHYDRSFRRYSEHSGRVIVDAIGAERPARILDVCCGTGAVSAAMLSRWPDAELAGVDLSPEMLSRARSHLARGVSATLRVATAEALPFPSASFDLVVCANAFHLLADQRRALAEFRRVVAPGGRLLILDWTSRSVAMRVLWGWLAVSQRARRRLLDPAGLEWLAREAGFIPRAVKPVRIPPAWRLMLLDARAPAMAPTPSARHSST